MTETAFNIMPISKEEKEHIYETCSLSIFFNATTNRVREVFGEPAYYDPQMYGGKTTREWHMKISFPQADKEDIYFTIYDWKEYRPYDDDEEVEWHVGGRWKSNDKEVISEALRTIGLLK